MQRQKLRRGKLVALYKNLKVTGNPDLAFLYRFSLTKDPEKGDKKGWVSFAF